MESVTDNLIFWGTRGGLPSGEVTSAKYGLATSCVELAVSDRHIILDAGSGISLFGKQIDPNSTKEIDILIGHYHYDHLIGLPFCSPLFTGNQPVRIFLPELDGKPGINAIDKLLSPPLFPITRQMFADKVRFHSFKPGETLTLSPDILVSTSLFPHPGQNCGYRLQKSGKDRLCYISDIENTGATTLDDVIAFNKDSTHLIIDSSYTQEEIKSRKGWGHLSLGDIECIAKALPHVQIFMYHHDIFKSDSQIDTDSKQLLSKYSNVRIAQQFDKIQLA